MSLLGQLVELYLILIFARIILTWFPITPGTTMAQVFSVVYRVTEPVLGPVRRVVPPLGPIDISPIVVIVVLQILTSYLR